MSCSNELLLKKTKLLGFKADKFLLFLPNWVMAGVPGAVRRTKQHSPPISIVGGLDEVVDRVISIVGGAKNWDELGGCF